MVVFHDEVVDVMARLTAVDKVLGDRILDDTAQTVGPRA